MRTATEEMHRPVATGAEVGELQPAPPLPVHSTIQPLLPWPGLRRGAVVGVAGSATFLCALVGEASGQGAWVAIVGWPELAPPALHEAGAKLEQIILVPNPGAKLIEATAILMDGMSIVVLRLPDGGISDADARSLAARARRRGCTFIPFGDRDRLPQTDLTLDVTKRSYNGLGMGHGRIRSIDVSVTARGRGAAARPCSAKIRLPFSAGPIPQEETQTGTGRHLRAV
ncbi:MAG: hypothetical protein HOV87_12050 [Catenulispora sp.]|nr:hypothetical protein [Catenulispora sp.]